MPSVLEVFRKNYPQLMRILPMNDEFFLADLYAENLLPGSLKDDLKLLPISQRATKFLDEVIKPSIEINDCTKFQTLLRLMMKNEDITIKNLATRVRNLLNEEMDTNPSDSVPIKSKAHIHMYNYVF